MNIHEYQAIEIFRQAGIPVVEGRVAVEEGEAQRIAEEIGYPVVLKAQVLTGGRGKAGGIKVVENEDGLKDVFRHLKGTEIKGYPVGKILVARAIDIRQEFYAGITVDHLRNNVVVIVSSSGGVDIEDAAQADREAVRKFYLAEGRSINKALWLEFIGTAFKSPSQQRDVTTIFQNLIKIFFDNDCSLVEINPLVIDGKGRILAADAKINFDDNALFRHKNIHSLQDLSSEDPNEIDAKKHGLSFVKLDGNIGCIVNGAGLAMATMDIIQLLEGRPANFLDVGGSSDSQKVLDAVRIILKNKKIKVILINIFGGITRCDDIAKGIIEAKKLLEIPVPLVVRLTGTNEEEAKELLDGQDIHTFSTMREAIVESVRLGRE